MLPRKALLAAACSFACAQTPATLVVRTARSLEVTTGLMVSPAVVVVRGERIAEVNPAALPEAATVVDLGDRTLR